MLTDNQWAKLEPLVLETGEAALDAHAKLGPSLFWRMVKDETEIDPKRLAQKMALALIKEAEFYAE